MGSIVGPINLTVHIMKYVQIIEHSLRLFHIVAAHFESDSGFDAYFQSELVIGKIESILVNVRVICILLLNVPGVSSSADN